MDLREQNWGIEIEMTGITRYRAAQVIADYFGTEVRHDGRTYDTYSAPDQQGRRWKVMSDASINCQRRENGRKVSAGRDYSVELVSPICQYEDIEKLQEIIRKLREAGAFCNDSVGIHIHINAAPFDAPHLRNLVNIVASKEDMIYRALQVNRGRELSYCKKVDPDFLERLNKQKPKEMEQMKRLWYGGYDGSREHYHSSRYHACNLHSVFQKGTIEFRAFNSNLHAGKVKAYLQFCLAITAQAHNQRSARPTKTVSDNEKYTFRVWLLRLGMIGDEFKTARKHLLDHLEGNIAWKDPMQAVRQKERPRQQHAQEAQPSQLPELTEAAPIIEEPEPEESQSSGFSMSM